jgi:hypothetical protein
VTSQYQQEVIQELHDPSVKSVVKEIKSSYLNILPGLPYPELPVVSIISKFSSLTSNYLDTIVCSSFRSCLWFHVPRPCHKPTGGPRSNLGVNANNQVFRHAFVSHRLSKYSDRNAVDNCWLRRTRRPGATRCDFRLHIVETLNKPMQ